MAVSDGTLVLEEGYINWKGAGYTPAPPPSGGRVDGNVWINLQSPWHAYLADINRIVFDGPITAGPSYEDISTVRKFNCNRRLGLFRY